MDYSTNAFSPLSFQRLPISYRLIYSACCPDKDLVVLISRLGGKDRMSLWKMHGSKCWEVDVGTDGNKNEEIVGLAWSPDGRSIAVAHDPPRVTLHSIQDGREERQLVLFPGTGKESTSHGRILDIWWFKEEKREGVKPIPDIFKRKGIITGSVHSILRMLPLLDHLQDESEKTTATDIFAFQGSQTKSTKLTIPDFMQVWPTLPPDLLLASISPYAPGKTPADLGDVDESNVNSILVVADDVGQLGYFLDGTYPLGKVDLPPNVIIPTLFKHPIRPHFYSFPQVISPPGEGEKDEVYKFTDIMPIRIDIPALEERKVRDVAKLSSTARELVWYTMRIVKEMRGVWMGSESTGGAREVGAKWTASLEATQKNHGQAPNAICDLTALLLTGRPSESLTDLLGSGEQMSERGIQKWESTMTEALVKLRDLAEKRLAPACQRLHLVMEELSALSQLTQFHIFNLKDKQNQITEVAQMLGRAIIIAAWMASAARRELFRFKEFIAWVRYETAAINSGVTTANNDVPPMPRHDVLEVNDYLVAGLIQSPMERFFSGPLPMFSLSELGVSSKQALSSVLQRAQTVANDPLAMAWQVHARRREIDHLDRNIYELINQIASSSQALFVLSAGAASTSAVISLSPNGSSLKKESTSSTPVDHRGYRFRERVVRDENETTTFAQYLAVRAPGDESLVCFVQVRYRARDGHEEGEKQPPSPAVAVEEQSAALVEFNQPSAPGAKVKILELEFFDDQRVVIVYKLSGQAGTFIGMVAYHDLGYRRQPSSTSASSREQVVHGLIERWRKGDDVVAASMPIKRCRGLTGCEDGVGSVAVNGKVGRTVACVLDARGMTLETLDMENEEEDNEEGGDLSMGGVSVATGGDEEGEVRDESGALAVVDSEEAARAAH